MLLMIAIFGHSKPSGGVWGCGFKTHWMHV